MPERGGLLPEFCWRLDRMILGRRPSRANLSAPPCRSQTSRRHLLVALTFLSMSVAESHGRLSPGRAGADAVADFGARRLPDVFDLMAPRRR